MERQARAAVSGSYRTKVASWGRAIAVALVAILVTPTVLAGIDVTRHETPTSVLEASGLPEVAFEKLREALPETRGPILGSPVAEALAPLLAGIEDERLRDVVLGHLGRGARDAFEEGTRRIETRRSDPSVGGLFVIPSGEAETVLSGTVYIDEDWVVQSPLRFENADVVFRTGNGKHMIQTDPGISLTILDSTVRQVDGRRELYGLIVANGPLVIERSTVSEIMVTAVARAGFLGATSRIVDSRFDNAVTALTLSQNALVDRTIFTRSFEGLLVEGTVVGSGVPKVWRSAFEMNEKGIVVSADAGGQFGALRMSANAIGVECKSSGEQDASLPGYEIDPARVNDSNIAENYGDAVSGSNGISITTPYGELVVADSRCIYDGNYYGGAGLAADSTFKSDGDTMTNTRDTPNALPGTPALPWPIHLITSTTTWSNSQPPPTLSGPVVVKYPGALTTSNLQMDPRGFTIGAKKNGAIEVKNTVFNGRTSLFVRNDGDKIENVDLTQEVVLNGVWSHRANSVIKNLNVLAGAPNGYGVFFWTALFKGDSAYVRTVDGGVFKKAVGGVRSQLDSPTIKNARFEDTAYPVITFLSTPEVSDNDIVRPILAFTTVLTSNPKYINNDAVGVSAKLIPGLSLPAKPEIEETDASKFIMSALDNNPTVIGNSATDMDSGVIAALGVGTVTISDNDFVRVRSGVMSVLAKVASDRNVYDRGMYGYWGLLNPAGITFTSDVFTNQVFGIASWDLGGPSITSSLFAFNYIGLSVSSLALANPPPPHSTSITNSNFIHNFGAGAVMWNFMGSAMTATCTGCWKETDESMEISATSTYRASSLGPNPEVPTPSWWSSRVITSSGTTTLSGTVNGPVVARTGGKIQVKDTTLDMNGFAIGAKGSGTTASPTGILEIVRSDIVNGAVIASNSTSATIELNRFEHFRRGVAVATFGNPATIRCNSFENIMSPASFLKGMPGKVLTFERNLVRGATSFSIGQGRYLPDYREDAVLTGNAFINIPNQITRLGKGSLTMTGNAFLDTGAVRDFMSDRTNKAPSADFSGNYWNHPDGPRVTRYHGKSLQEVLHAGPGTRLNLGDDNSTPLSTWQPFLSTLPSPAPCVDFRFTAGPLTELDTMVFTDRSFDPMGNTLTRTWNFGDGTILTVDEPTVTHRYADGGTYTVTLTATTSQGSTASASKSVLIQHVNPVADFAASVVDEITPVQFTDASTHPNPADAPPSGWSYAWSFNNGEGTSTARHPTFRFADGGSKTARLTVTDNDGRTHTKQITIVVPHVAPIANFAFTPADETESVTFTDTSTHPNAPTDGIVSRSWSCSDGKKATAASFSHRFADGGTYECSLTVTDNDGKASTVLRSVPIGHVAPAANFIVSGSTELDTFAFTDTSTHPNPADAPPSGWTWTWDFGDGGHGSARNPNHRFADGGTARVALTVTDNDGRTSTFARDVPVAHVSPVAAIGVDTSKLEPATPIAFTDASTHPNSPGDALVSWAWSFGDGATSAEANPSHVYAAIGTYLVTLTVTDDDGLTSTATRSLRVGNHAPVAAFDWTPAIPNAKEVVAFRDNSSDADGSVANWFWTFGDGRSSSERSPEVTYTSPGVRSVCLRVWDNDGKSSAPTCRSVIIDDRLEGTLRFDRPLRTDREINAELTLRWDDGRPVPNVYVRYEKWLRTNYVPPHNPPPTDTCGGESCPWSTSMDAAPYYRLYEGYTDPDGRLYIYYYDNEPRLGAWQVTPSNVPGNHEYRLFAWTRDGYLGNTEHLWITGSYFVEEDRITAVYGT